MTDVAAVSSSAAGNPATDPSKTGAFLREYKALIAAPFAIAATAAGLLALVMNTDLDSVEQRSLNWDQVRPQIADHLYIAFWSTVFVILIAVPLGILLTRPRYQRLSGPVLAVATSGQATPAFGLIIFAFALLGRGQWTTVWALVLFAILPVLRNTMVGLEQVSAPVIEAGRGMGLTRGQVLRSIELPLAVPVILAGVRVALVINVGMATLGFLIGGGGLGILISAGLSLSREFVVFVGAALTALVALTVDWVAAMVERALRPKGL